MIGDKDRVMKIIPFHGEHKKWTMWETIKLPNIHLYGVLNVLDGKT